MNHYEVEGNPLDVSCFYSCGPEDRLFYQKKHPEAMLRIFSSHPFGTKFVRNKNPSKEFNSGPSDGEKKKPNNDWGFEKWQPLGI